MADKDDIELDDFDLDEFNFDEFNMDSRMRWSDRETHHGHKRQCYRRIPRIAH